MIIDINSAALSPQQQRPRQQQPQPQNHCEPPMDFDDDIPF